MPNLGKATFYPLDMAIPTYNPNLSPLLQSDYFHKMNYWGCDLCFSRFSDA